MPAHRTHAMHAKHARSGRRDILSKRMDACIQTTSFRGDTAGGVQDGDFHSRPVVRVGASGTSTSVLLACRGICEGRPLTWSASRGAVKKVSKAVDDATGEANSRFGRGMAPWDRVCQRGGGLIRWDKTSCAWGGLEETCFREFRSYEGGLESRAQTSRRHCRCRLGCDPDPGWRT
jgi:hypothetical protein